MTIKEVAVEWHSDLPVFASEKFLKIAGNEYGWLGGVDDANTLLCILPYTIIQKPFFKMARFRLETIPVEQPFGDAQEKEFLNGIIRHFRATGVDLVLPGATNAIFRTYPDGAVAAPYGTLVIDLDQSENDLWSNLHSKHRNVIRNAMNKSAEIRCGMQHLHTAYALIRETLQRSRLRFMRLTSFEQLVRGLGDNVKIYIVEHLGQPQGCAVIPFSNYSAYYLYGGSILNPLTGALNLLQWEAIMALKKHGVKRYDFGGVRINPEKGSKQEQLKRFKERFGGRLIQGYMWKYPVRTIKYAAYCLAVRAAWGGDIVDREHHKLIALQDLPRPPSPPAA
jgi:hypothetical protein